MNYYDTFIQSTVEPKKRWDEGIQALANKVFTNASTYQKDTVEEEIEFGTQEYKVINCRVVSLVNATTGQRINDDYKKITFPNLAYQPLLGSRYRFANNIWLAYSTDNILSSTSNIYVRRCNNTFNFEDKYGNILREPCVIDYKINETQLQRTTSTEVPNGRIEILCQYNKNTKYIDINDRFLFGDKAYKIRSRSDYDRRNTFDNTSARILSFYVDYDNVSEDDNFELGVANYVSYNYEIKSNFSEIKNIIGSKGKLNAEILLNSNITNEDIVWASSNEDIASIDATTGEYLLRSLGDCTFTATMVNKSDVNLEVKVSVTEEILQEYSTIVSPNLTYLKLNSFKKITIKEYLNNEYVLETPFEFEFYGVSNSNYIVKDITSNSFVLGNIKTSKEKLTIRYKNLRTQEENELKIELGGLI